MLARCGLLFAAALAFAVGSRAGEGNRGGDAIRVWFDGGDCGTDHVEVEAYDRQSGAWLPHPTHPRVPVRSCQTEEAGRLWNELRYRCAMGPGDRVTGWRPLSVFDADVMSRCSEDRRASGAHRTAITVSSPAEGSVVRAPEPFVELRGSVDVDGRAGSDYDVVLLLDRGAPAAAVEAQIAAARAFVSGLTPRLGAVRIALLSYPTSPQDGDPLGARRELAWSSDFAAIDAALQRLSRRPVVSPTALSDALDAAADALADARPSARAVIAMGVDGARIDATGEPAPRDLRGATRVGARGAALHWVALGGLAPEDPALVKRVLEKARGTFRRVPPQSYSTHFFDAIALPVAEAVWVEAPTAPAPGVPASLDGRGGFSARVPVARGKNTLEIRARTSDGALHERRFGLVFDDARAQRKQVEIQVEPEKKR